MCNCGGYGSLPYGVPINEETHEKYSNELKEAWEKFDNWWKNAQEGPDGLIDRSKMPEDVKTAMKLIKETPIPGYEGTYTGEDSCYMIGVELNMTKPT
ncbi:MAG TPA: hypothetical protein VLH94_02795 [Spirochaetia bacterium]|nr:hypothetical protein [Spirochaetia bacterium]